MCVIIDVVVYFRRPCSREGLEDGEDGMVRMRVVAHGGNDTSPDPCAALLVFSPTGWMYPGGARSSST